MDSTLSWVVVAALTLLVILALIMGPRFFRGRFRFGKHVSAELGGDQEARVSNSTAACKDISVTVQGAGSVVQSTESAGKEIRIGGGTGPEPHAGDDEPH